MNRRDTRAAEDGDGAGSALSAAAAADAGPALLRLAWRILRDRQLAEDVCQQALLKAWQQEGPIDRPAHWLRRVVVNECFSVLRHRRVEREARTTVVLHQASPADPAQGVALRESVVAALSQLPDLTRDIVVLRLMDGMTGNEVSDIMQCSASEVSRRLHQGMEQLRIVLRNEV